MENCHWWFIVFALSIFLQYLLKICFFQGSSPIDYLHDYIDDYIECKINPESRDDCQEVLDPVMASKSPKFPPIGTKERWDFIQQYNDMHRVHHDWIYECG